MKILRPLRAIRQNCLDCMCGSSNEVQLCTIKDCPLFPYRFGKRPYKKPRSPKQKENDKKTGIRFKKWREEHKKQ